MPDMPDLVDNRDEKKPDFRRGRPETRPTHCPQCQFIFEADPFLQMAALHVADIEGASAAQNFVDERLEWVHVDH